MGAEHFSYCNNYPNVERFSVFIPRIFVGGGTSDSQFEPINTMTIRYKRLHKRCQGRPRYTNRTWINAVSNHDVSGSTTSILNDRDIGFEKKETKLFSFVCSFTAIRLESGLGNPKWLVGPFLQCGFGIWSDSMGSFFRSVCIEFHEFVGPR